MRHLGGFKPLVAINLVITNDMTDAVSKDFGAASGERIDSRGLQLLERLANGQLCAPSKIGHLHHRERLQMHLWETLLQSGTEIEEVLEGQVGMKSTDNMKFRYRFGISRCSGFESLFERHRICAGCVFLPAKGTQTARSDADVGGIDVPI